MRQHCFVLALLLAQLCAAERPFTAPDGSADIHRRRRRRGVAPEDVQMLVDAIHFAGGYVDQRVMVGHGDLGRQISAASAIAHDEVLLRIPWNATFHVREDATGKPGAKALCELASSVHQHMQLAHDGVTTQTPADSAFHVYAKHVQGYKPQLPHSWAQEDRDRLEQLLGRDVWSSRGNTTQTYLECGGHLDDHLHQIAFVGTHIRSVDVRLDVETTSPSMIPLFDMCNHRNGRWNNVVGQYDFHSALFSMHAKRDIQQGEQLYVSYGDRLSKDMFIHWGFLEEYPQRWDCNSHGVPHGDASPTIEFRVDKDSASDRVHLISWGLVQEETLVVPRGAAVCCRSQLDLLSSMASNVKRLPRAEYGFARSRSAALAWDVHDAWVAALEVALRVAEKSQPQEEL